MSSRTPSSRRAAAIRSRDLWHVAAHNGVMTLMLDCRFVVGALRCVDAVHFTRHTSHLTPHTSHLTLHTSHLTPHTSHLTPHTSHLTPHTSHFTPHTSHLTPHTSHLTPNINTPFLFEILHTSHLKPHLFLTNNSTSVSLSPTALLAIKPLFLMSSCDKCDV